MFSNPWNPTTTFIFPSLFSLMKVNGNGRRFGIHDKLYFGFVMKGEMLIIDFRGAVAKGSQNLVPLVKYSFDLFRVIQVC